ncbi:MAG: hypothetical protein GX620_10240, partial [Chloroflexi bacterium]|nr:hypothetical protein [Chloroflexota bacterium]
MGWAGHVRHLPDDLGADEFAFAMTLAMTELDQILEVSRQQWNRLDRQCIRALRELAVCERQDREPARGLFLEEMARVLEKDVLTSTSAPAGPERFASYVRTWLPRWLVSMKGSPNGAFFVALMAAHTLPEFIQVALGEEIVP